MFSKPADAGEMFFTTFNRDKSKLSSASCPLTTISAHHSPVLPPEHETALHQVVMPAGVVVSASEPAHTALQSYACSQDETHNPATCLVPELLCLIFSQRDLSFADRIRTSHVCHAWREASLAFPATLWTRVPPTTRLDTMAPLLDRTAALVLPVDLMAVSLTKESRLYTICELLKRHMWHIRTLGLTIFDCTVSQRNEITSAQEVPAPMLRRFLWDERNSWGPVPLPTSGFFGGHAPKLERLELSRYTAPDISSFSALQSIRRIIIRGRVFIRPHDKMWADIVTFPRLTNLEFEMGPSTVLPALGGANVPSTKIPLPRTLARLGLRVSGAVQLSVLDMDLISGIPLVCVAPEFESNWLSKEIVLPFLSHVSPHPDEIEAILSVDSVSFRIINRECNMRTRAFLNVALAHTSFWESTFNIVTSLTLYLSSDFLKRGGAAACSNVEHLTVGFEERPENELHNLWMTFPKLRTLTLALAYPYRLGLSADAVTVFISHLDYEAPKLETLCFRGTVAAPSEAFYGVAEEVRLDRYGLISFPDLWEDM